MSTEKSVSIQEAATILRLPEGAVRRLVEMGELPGSTPDTIKVSGLAALVGRPFRPRKRSQEALSDSHRIA